MLAAAASATFKSRAALHLENLALRHQLGLLQLSVKRPKLTPPDRLLWAWLSQLWNSWRSAPVIVKPDTVLAWHRKSFRLFWAWKVRHGKPGRPAVPKEVRALIRTMSFENPLWGAPRIHGELLGPASCIAPYPIRFTVREAFASVKLSPSSICFVIQFHPLL
jgi:hypothetical protein